MEYPEKKISWILLGVLIIGSLGTAPALAKSQKNEKQATSSPNTEAGSPAYNLAPSTVPEPTSQRTPQPGPAWKTIGGTVKHINGDVYTVEDYEGNQIQLYTSPATKRLRGNKQIGDRVRAEITQGNFANSIQ
jgi:hypothetical protein